MRGVRALTVPVPCTDPPHHTLFPLGLLQLYESISHGYYEARAMAFLTNPTNRLLEWLRLPGDLLFIRGGVLPLLWLCWCGVRHRVPFVLVPGTTPGDSAVSLFTDVTAVETVPIPEADVG
jgi:nitric oxide reductase subunit B